jgi:hypothetical protein
VNFKDEQTTPKPAQPAAGGGAGPETKVIGGKTYVKVQGGWKLQ